MKENLPVFNPNQELTGNRPISNSLVARGLTAIRNRKSDRILLIENPDHIYSQARLTFNLLTDPD